MTGKCDCLAPHSDKGVVCVYGTHLMLLPVCCCHDSALVESLLAACMQWWWQHDGDSIKTASTRCVWYTGRVAAGAAAPIDGRPHTLSQGKGCQ